MRFNVASLLVLLAVVLGMAAARVRSPSFLIYLPSFQMNTLQLIDHPSPQLLRLPLLAVPPTSAVLIPSSRTLSRPSPPPSSPLPALLALLLALPSLLSSTALRSLLAPTSSSRSRLRTLLPSTSPAASSALSLPTTRTSRLCAARPLPRPLSSSTSKRAYPPTSSSLSIGVAYRVREDRVPPLSSSFLRSLSQ